MAPRSEYGKEAIEGRLGRDETTYGYTDKYHAARRIRLLRFYPCS